MVAALLGAAVVVVASGVGLSIHQYLGGIDLAASGAALSLAVMLGAIFLIRDQSIRHKFTEAAGVRGEIRRLRLDLDRLGRRIEDIDGAAAASDAEPEPPLLAELEELRRTIGSFAAEHGMAPPPPARVELPPLPTPDHSLELFLEPIVALMSGRTAHYRAAAVLEAPDGRHVPYEDMARQLDSHALRPALDIHCLARVLPLTRKLVLRRQNTLVFVPVGGETLANGEAMGQLAALLASDEGFASSVAFEIDHKTMAGLSAKGVEGLAALARQGAAMALTRVAPEGVDLPALRDLHFVFLSFPAARLPRTALGKPDWSGLARFAGDHGFAIEVRGLETGDQVARAKKWAKLGSGPAFAPPRRVRSDAGAASSFSAAA
jgi:EAL domain-containing protein (putative c-di-GMP-specific phosphodiesterase class I)